jgi:hypothetical protein
MSTAAAPTAKQAIRTSDLVPVESLIREQTGRPISQRAFERQKQRSEAIETRLEMLARVAEEGDSKVVKRVMKDTLSLVGLMSGEGNEVIRVPRRVLFPGAAERSRKDTLNAFCYFLREHPGCRHVIVTCGVPVKVESVRDALCATCDQIRRLRSRPWFRKIGEVVMRSAEFTVTGEKYFCHVHLVIRPWTPVNEDDWIELIRKMGVMFGSIVLDDKMITDVYGTGQYLFDGNDITNIDPFDLCRLQELMRHTRTHEPQGTFREMCGELRRTKTKITWSGNQLVKVRRNDGSLQVAASEGATCDDYDGNIGRANLVSSAANRQPAANRLLRITVPFARATRVREPHLLILNYDGDFQGYLDRNPQLAKFREELLPQWMIGVSAVVASPNVHCTVQVSDQTEAPNPSEQESQDDAEGDVDDLIDPSDLQMIGIDPADFLWRPIPRPRLNVFEEDENSFPI